MYFTSYSTNKDGKVPAELISLTSEDVQGFMASLHGLNGNKLDLILHSPGGHVEAAEQIVNYLRMKYHHIRAIIPQCAMSAATMLACACDEIVMGKHSAIGPIDPQITFPVNNTSFTAPAYSLLSEFNKAQEEILSNPNVAPLWIPKIASIPPGLLDICEKSIQLAKEKVCNWLKSYMFKNKDDEGNLAKEISDWLGTNDEHLTHGRPINIQIAKEKGLIVTELEKDQNLQEKVLSVYHSTLITFEITKCVKIIENQNGIGLYTSI